MVTKVRAGRNAARKIAALRPRPARMSRRSAAALATLCLGIGMCAGYAAIDAGAARRSHGVAQVVFPPWLGESEAFARIDRAGGVPIAEPGAPAGRFGLFRAIAASADFAAQARAEGALFILY